MAESCKSQAHFTTWVREPVPQRWPAKAGQSQKYDRQSRKFEVCYWSTESVKPTVHNLLPPSCYSYYRYCYCCNVQDAFTATETGNLRVDQTQVLLEIERLRLCFWTSFTMPLCLNFHQWRRLLLPLNWWCYLLTWITSRSAKQTV